MCVGFFFFFSCLKKDTEVTSLCQDQFFPQSRLLILWSHDQTIIFSDSLPHFDLH